MNASSYLSPFTWRYASEAMRAVWSEEHKHRLWRSVWVALARAQHEAGLVNREELADLIKQRDDLDIDRISQIEKETGHDVVAAIREYAEKASIGGGKIHLGATSMDVVDNADVIRIREALAIITKSVNVLLLRFAEKIDAFADTPCMGYTHLQPAQPTTVGYRLSNYAQDLLIDGQLLGALDPLIRGKGVKGAVGSRASFVKLLEGKRMGAEALDQAVMKGLGIAAWPITTQVYPRKVDYLVLTILASIAQSLARFAEDVRILQSLGEWSEPFGGKQVGSSAMPFKRNPLHSEKICSLGRFVAQLPAIAWGNAALSHLERTLDDSANRRLVIAEAFLALDEMLITAQKVCEGLTVHRDRIAHNLDQYGPFAATEVIMIEAVKRGADRQKLHELLRTLSMRAWEDVQRDKPNPMKNLLIEDKQLARYLTNAEIEKYLDVAGHVGDAPARARMLAKTIQKRIGVKR